MRTSRSYITASVAILGGLGVAACGQWQRVGTGQEPNPDLLVPQLFDRGAVYNRLGLISSEGPVEFVGSVHFLASETVDTSLVAVAAEVPYASLDFRRRRSGVYESEFTIEVAFVDRAGRRVAGLTDDVMVSADSMRLTQSSEVSRSYQTFLRVAPGEYRASITVENSSGESSASSKSVTVPRFERNGTSLSSVIPVAEVTAPRVDLASIPGIRINPRAMVPFGGDSIRFYMEGYGVAGNAVATVGARYVPNNTAVYSARTRFAGAGDVGATVIAASTDSLPIGELRFNATLVGSPDTMSTNVIVGFSNEWAFANFDDMLDLLRYFGTDRAIEEMRAASIDDRPGMWRAFLRQTDPEPLTPEHESLNEYFALVQEANRRFAESGTPGWRTDRGEAYITLGPPDEIFEPNPDPQAQVRIMRWTYVNLRLVLDFVDQTGAGRFRMSTASRAEYQRILNSSRVSR